MKNKLIGTLVVIVVVIGIVIANYDKTKDSRIVIGAVIPQSGFGAYWGAPVLKGIRIAEADLKVKYPERKIVVVVEDSQSKAPSAVSAAQKLLSVDKADALYAEFSSMAGAVSPLAKSAGKAFVYSASSEKIADGNDLSVKTFVTFSVACDAFGKYVNDPSKKILVINQLGDAASFCVKALENRFSVANVRLVDNVVGTDFRTILLQNKEFNPDYIFPLMYEDGSYALFKQKNQLGMAATMFCYKQDCVTEKNLKNLSTKETEGSIFFELPIDQAFEAKARAAYPDMNGDDIQAASNSYQGIIALGQALVKCKDKSGRCVIDNIANENPLASPGYKNAGFTNRILGSDIRFGVIHNGEAEPLKLVE